MGDRYSYRNLILWQRAQELAHQVIQITKQLPNTWASAIIGRQIIASATSVSANIAEGHGRFAIGAHRNHLSIARGSAAETDSWLDLLRREGFLTPEREKYLHNQYEQIMAMLTAKINTLNSLDHSDNRSVRESTIPYEAEPSTNPVFPFTDADYVLIE